MVTPPRPSLGPLIVGRDAPHENQRAEEDAGMKIGLITTVDTNIGDDLIRDGITRSVHRVVGRGAAYIVINKHDPLTVLGRTNPARLVHFLPNRGRTRHRLLRNAARRLGPLTASRFHDTDLVIQCGTPQYWPDCRLCEWAPAIWDVAVTRLPTTTPVLNLAAGSCYAWAAAAEGVELGADAAYINKLTRLCTLTTVRDRLAEDIVASVGGSPLRLPCAAFISGPPPIPTAAPADGPILVNYMAGGGHFAFPDSQSLDPHEWEATMRRVIVELRRGHKVIMLCHDDREVSLARTVAPGADVLLPRTPDDYWEAVSRAGAGLVNRLHAAVALAGRGIPVIAVGTDTRLLMIEELGTAARFVADVTTESLLADVSSLLLGADAERQRLLGLRAEVERRYDSIIGSAIAHE